MSLQNEHSSAIFTHLIVLGVDSIPSDMTIKDIEQGKLQPSLIDIYFPLQAESTNPPIYLTNLSLWVFPDGFKILNESGETIHDNEISERFIIPNERKTVRIVKQKHIHSFVLTDENYTRRYCSALTFHEPFSFGKTLAKSARQEQCETIYVPKSIIMISEAPCLDAQKKILKHIHKSISFDKSKNSFIDLEKYIRIPIKYIKHAHSLLVPGLDSILMSEEDNNKNSPPESELGPVVKDSQLSEFYISAAYSLFPEDKPGHEFKERAVLELRDWVREKGSETEIFRYRVPKNIGIEIPTTSFKPLFKRLSAKNVVRLLKCILLERKLIFFSSQPDEIPYITQALLSMLWPLQWCCLYVPRLPIAIWETLHAIMPYIVGLPSQYKEFIAMNIDFMDKIVIDLDNDALYIGEDTCDFPKKIKEFLINKLEEIWSLGKNISSKASPEFWAELTLKTKHYCNTFLLMLTNNYLEFYKSPSRKAIKGRAGASASEIFDFQTYFSQFNEEHRSFLQEAQHSMLFIHLIEETYETLFNQQNTQIISLNTTLQNQEFSQTRISAASVNFKTLQNHYHERNSVSNQNDIKTCPNPIVLQQKIQQQGISAFVKELKGILDTFGRTGKNNKKLIGFINILDPKIINYIEIVHGCIIKEAMSQFCCPEKIDLLPYLAKYYCNFLLNDDEKFINSENKNCIDDENLHLSYIDEDKPHIFNEEDKDRFRGLDKQKLTSLNSMFISFIPRSISSIDSPSKFKETPTSTPTRQSFETFEVIDLSSLRDSFLNQRNKFSKEVGSQVNGKRINHVKPSLDYIPSKIYGPRLNVETPKGLTETSWMDSISSIGALELRKAVSLCDNIRSNVNDSFTSQNFSLKIESPKLSSALPHKILESGSFTEFATTLNNKEKEVREMNEDALNNEFGVNLYRAVSEKINTSDHNKHPYLMQYGIQEPLKEISISYEKEHDGRERRRKLIFEPKSPEKESIKYLKNSELKLRISSKRQSITAKENRLEKENKFIKNQMRQNSIYPWDNCDMSLWEIIVGEKENKKKIPTILQDPVLKVNGSQHNPWAREEVNMIQERIREEGSILVKNLDTGELMVSEILEEENRKRQVSFRK